MSRWDDALPAPRRDDRVSAYGEAPDATIPRGSAIDEIPEWFRRRSWRPGRVYDTLRGPPSTPGVWAGSSTADLRAFERLRADRHVAVDRAARTVTCTFGRVHTRWSVDGDMHVTLSAVRWRDGEWESV